MWFDCKWPTTLNTNGKNKYWKMEQNSDFLKHAARPKKRDGLLELQIEKYGGFDYMEEYLSINKGIIYEYMLERFCYSVRAGEEEIDMFLFDGNDIPLTSVRGDWKECLNKMIDFYVDLEEYEKCAVCKQLLDILKSETKSN
tara:strand:+ start:27 stop:452 length:426 start_codon:yes stop_codon:yes gene_type:complete